MGGSAESLCPPYTTADPGRVAQGDAVRDGYGGDPSRHPSEHLPAPDGPAQREACGFRPGRSASLLLPEPTEAGGRDPRPIGRRSAHPSQDEGSDRPREGGGEKGTGGSPGLPDPAPVLGLRQNLAQFSLLVLVNAFVGGMVGLERAILPLIAEQEFGLVSKSALLSFRVGFGFVKAFTNLAAGRFSDRIGRKGLFVGGWVGGLPGPLLLMGAPPGGWGPA